MSNAILATGTLVSMGDGGSPEAFTAIAELKSITGPGLSRNQIDVTTHNSVGGWEEILPGLARSGELTFQINFLPTHATHNPTTGLLAAFQNKTKKNMRLTFPGGSPVWNFAAWVVGFEVSAEVDDVLAADVTVKLTDTVTLA